MDTTVARPRTTRRARVLGVTALLAVAAGILSGAGAAQADAPPTGDAGAAWRSYELVNSARAAAGLPALGETEEANRAATDWAFRMAGDGNLRHNPALASQLQDWSLVAENVGVGADSDELAGAFMASPAHRANILRPEVSVIGLGAARSGDGRLWIVQVFEKPNGQVPVSFLQVAAPQPIAAPLPEVVPVPASEGAPRIGRDTRDTR